MINKSMKKYQDILDEASQAALNSLSHRQQVSSIADILEASEKYLGRPLSESEIYSFTEILIEKEEPAYNSRKHKDKSGTEQIFKKDNYRIEIITPQGKVIRSASSQKGLLDVIHRAKSFRVLDSNNRDITNKVKNFVKERQKQAQLRKNLKKKGRVNEEILTERIGAKQLAQLFLATKLAFSPAAAMPAAKAAAPIVTQGVVQVEKAAVQAGTQAAKTATTQAAKTATQAAPQTAKTATQAAPQATKTATQTAKAVETQTAPQTAKTATQTAKGTAQAATQTAVQAAKATSQEATKQASQQAAKQAASQQAAAKAVSQAVAPANAVSQAPAKATQAATAAGAAAAAGAGVAAATGAAAKLRAALFGGGDGGVEPGFGVGNPSADLYNDTLETQERTGVGGTIYYS